VSCPGLTGRTTNTARHTNATAARFGHRCGTARVARKPTRLESPPDPEIARQERVGISECAQADIGNRPRPDAFYGGQPLGDGVPVGAGIEDHLS